MAGIDIVCLKISGASIPYYVGKLLAIASIKLYQAGEKQTRLKGDNYQGILTCGFKRCGLGDLNGIGFVSTIEYDLPREWGGGSRESQINFFVQESVLNADLMQEINLEIIDPNLN